MAENEKLIPKRRFKEFQGTNGWEQRKLGELMEIASASRVHKDEWTESGVPFFRSSDVVAEFKGVNNNKAFISFELYKELSKKSGCIQMNDLLVTGGGSIGIPYLARNSEPLYFKDADLIWLKNSNNINSSFLYIFFTTATFRGYVNSITHIGTISHYTIEQVKSTPIKVPEKEEQRKIGDFFCDLDNLITLHKCKLEKTKALKSAYMSEMFPAEGERVPKRRFAEFTDEWEQRKLGEVADVIMGQSPDSINYTDNPNDHILVQGNADIKNGKVVPRVYTTQITKKANKGDLIFSVRAPVGDVGKTDYNVVLGRGVAAINGNEFIYQALVRMNKFGYWDKIMQGSTFESINSNDLKKALIFLPSISEQAAIGNFFRTIDNLITHHQQKLDKLQNIKKAYLNEMFI